MKNINIMKKTLFLLPLAALALTACSEDEPIESNRGEAIDFRPSMGNFTRASETTNANLSSMEVTAFIGSDVYFKDINFSKGNDGFFTSVHNYLWPGDNSELSFYAYSPSAEKLGADITWSADSKVLENFAVADSIADQVDFITAYSTGTKDKNETAGVPLTFNHQLSEIEIQAKGSNDSYTVKVAGIRIGRAEYLGSFDFATSTWTLDSWHDTAVYDSFTSPVTLSSTPENVMGPSGNAMLLPQQLTPWSPTADPDNVAREAYLSVLVNITSSEGFTLYPFPSDTKIDPNTGKKREYAWASIPINTKWEAGKKYIYTLDFSEGAGFVDPDDPTPGKPVLGGPVKFTVKVVDWVDTPTPLSMKTSN